MRTTNIALSILLGATALGCTPFLNSLDDTFGSRKEDGPGGADGGGLDGAGGRTLDGAGGKAGGGADAATRVPGGGGLHGADGGQDGGQDGEVNAPPLPPAATFYRYLKAQPPNSESQFGISVAASGGSVAVNAPFEDVNESDGGQSIKRGGVTYFYPNATEPPVRLVAPNVGVDDGFLPGNVEPPDWQPRGEGWGSTALALNEKYLVVGVAGEDSGNPADPSDNSAQDSGAVYVYRRSALGATPQYLKPPFPTRNEWFGRAVVLSGKWLFVGAPLEASGTTTNPSDTSAPAAGAVFVYEDVGDRFEPAGYVKAPFIQTGDEFGRSIAADSDAIVIGAPTEDSASTFIGGDPSDDSLVGSGAAWVYRYDGAKWNPEEYLKPGTSLPLPDGGTAAYGSFFGVSVALSGDRIAVGAPNAPACDATQPSADGRGAVHLFWRTESWRTGGRWTWTGCLSPHGPNRDAFGWTLDMTPEHLVVGAVWDSEKRDGPQPAQGTIFSGGAYLFDPVAGGRWVERQFLKAPNTIYGDIFGYALKLTSERLVVGAPFQSSASTDVRAPVVDDAKFSGAAYVYTLGVSNGTDAAAP